MGGCRHRTLTDMPGATLSRRRRSILCCWPGERIRAPVLRLNLAPAATKFWRPVDPPFDQG